MIRNYIQNLQHEIQLKKNYYYEITFKIININFSIYFG